MTLAMGVSNATSLYVRYVVVLIYFTKRGRIEAFLGVIQLSDWLDSQLLQLSMLLSLLLPISNCFSPRGDGRYSFKILPGQKDRACGLHYEGFYQSQ